MKLYFIALIPHTSLQEEVKQLKEEMKTRFEAKHALKSPAHITLQMPFKRDEEEENKLIAALEDFAQGKSEFTIHLNGFGHFSDRVIYINVEEFEPIQKLHAQLNQLLLHSLSFQEKEIKTVIHPHMTLATRDLSKPAFKEAWSELQLREFHNYFRVNSIFLLKHNGKYWDVNREFLFVEKG